MVEEITNFPLSKSTINRNTDDMSHDAQEVLRHKLKNNSFPIHVYESTDFINKSYVLVFVRFFK